MLLANKEMPKEESNHPYGDKAHGPMDEVPKASAFALCEEYLVEKHEVYFDQS